jgi:hypothetical protein
VSTDYGQQKMTFFSPDDGEYSDVFYPTETTLTLQLQEVAYRAVSDAINEKEDPTKTIK